MKRRIIILGAGSPGFSLAIARGLMESELVGDAVLVLMDIDASRLSESERRIGSLIKGNSSALELVSTTELSKALDGADFVVTCFAPHRMDFWEKDIRIAADHGIDLLQGENGGPAGQIHALRNIGIMMDIVRCAQSACPDCWIMNFTNPMSMVCTYLYKYTSIKSLGFCHQVHGSVGVVAEMLGLEPGDLRVLSAGINHMNFLIDIYRQSSGVSFKDRFLELISESPYWHENIENVPEQMFSLEFYKAFGIYPIGYDNHIVEYFPFFYNRTEWEELKYRSSLDKLSQLPKSEITRSIEGNINDVELERILRKGKFPFPKDPTHPYYRETPVRVMEALVSGEPTYFDAMILLNRGSVSNLPDDAVLDLPGIVVGGRPRAVEIGPLPTVPAELCRRQITIHELLVRAAVEGEPQLFFESLSLDPFVRSLRTARALQQAYLSEYQEYLPFFK